MFVLLLFRMAMGALPWSFLYQYENQNEGLFNAKNLL